MGVDAMKINRIRVHRWGERRGAILLVSLLVVTIGALMGTTILYFAGAGRHAAEVGLRAPQSRAMAWSGVQAVMAELSAQREALLQGAAPTITEYWLASPEEAVETSGPRWGFRVRLLSKAEGSEAVACEAEMGKLDVNSATAQMLGKLPGVSASLADAIVSARKERPFLSVPDLLRVPGMTAELLYNGSDAGKNTRTKTKEPSDEPPASKGAKDEATPSGSDEGTKPPTSDAGHEASGRPLADFVTAFSFDPEVQLGFGAKADESRGNQRINLNVEWSDTLGSAIERRFDKNVADGVKSLMQGGTTFAKTSSIVKTLREFRVKPEEWPEILDAFTTNGEEYRFGQVDLSTASSVVLACVPGISRDAAREITFRRSRMDEEKRRTVVWPVLEGVLSEEEFELAVDYLTTRCMQWRVIVEGGVLPPREDGSERWDVGDEHNEVMSRNEFTRAADGRGESRVSDRVILEAVIDISSKRPRVAMLRDVTWLPLARSMHLNVDTSAAEPETTTSGSNTPGSRASMNSAGSTEIGATRTRGDGDDMMPGANDDEDLMSTPEDAPLDGETERGEAQAPEGSNGTLGTTNRGASGDRRIGRWSTPSGGGR